MRGGSSQWVGVEEGGRLREREGGGGGGGNAGREGNGNGRANGRVGWRLIE